MSAKVGIVVVSYNASVAVRVTLASLRAAKNDVASELVLVDNASREDERERIRAAVDRHVAEAGLPWRHVQQEENLGFSGGNNVGIRMLLEDPTVTHVCLLNSDVIVPHAWLDRLLESGQAIVSPVTNKADSEQCVPVDYSLMLERCLDEEGERLRDGVFSVVDGFAREWHEAWRGNVVDCDATFFCVLISRSAVEQIGVLDEQFFPGGFEDDDYCARARAAGFGVYLARDVFVHHWGSASFGQLKHEYLSENARRNLRHLETKHGIEWRRRPEKPFVSFAQDVEFAVSTDKAWASQQRFFAAYRKALGRSMGNYVREYANLNAAVSATSLRVPDALAIDLEKVRARGNLGREWRELSEQIDAQLRAGSPSPEQREAILGRLSQFARDLHGLVTCTFAMHEILQAHAESSGSSLAVVSQPWWRRLFSMFRHGIPFLLRLRGIVFFAGYPYAAREKDGYFQRIRAIDGVFDDRWRIYFDPEPLPGQTQWYDLPAPRTVVLRPVGGRFRRWLTVVIVTACAVRCRAVYFHSVLRMHDMGFGRLMRWPWLRKVLDVHGVVPEEFRMHNDFYSAVMFEAHERTAVRRARGVVVVTEAMRRYFQQKYRDQLRGEVVVLPIFPGMASLRQVKPLVEGKPVVVYAGGLHRWQQVPKMVDAILRTRDACRHRFYCTDPDAVIAMFPADALADADIVIESKSHDELVECYRECHYGFVLREDSVVNHVACPTKVVEYLAMGIVPILDCQSVGDFTDLGMRFVTLADFVAGKLPAAAEREAMARDNFEVFGRLRGQREGGVGRLRELFGRGATSGTLTARVLWELAKLFPMGTRRGTLARSVWAAFSRKRAEPIAPAPEVGPQPTLAPCDVVVQVGNFCEGGLENVVLDLNEAMQSAGFKVALLVLGEAGAAVERAREQGVEVCVARYSEAAYRTWLTTAAPKVVMSHYSVEGAAVCAALDVALVQVIHNTYMWLDKGQLEAMRESAAHTTTFVAVSEFAKDYSVRRLGVPGDRCVVIPNGIDVQRFRKLQDTDERTRLRADLGFGEDAFVFMSVGSVNHQKNHLSLLRAFRDCVGSCSGARLVIVGPWHEGELLNECRRFVDRNDLGAFVTFTGGVSDPQRYYTMADAYVHAAFFEGGPLTLLEALAAGLPIVTVATGIARHFADCAGVHVVPAHFDVTDYTGHITAMKASAATEERMTAAMQQVYRDRECPTLPAGVVDLFDRSNTYRAYVDLVRELTDAPTLARPVARRSWPELISDAG